MPEYKHLISVADAAGRLMLLASSDGRSLVTNEGDCTPCDCTQCQTIRRWNRCPLPPGQENCTSAPDHIWLCEPSPCSTTVGFANACFSKTDTTLPVGQLPAGDMLVDAGQVACRTGCDDPNCTACPAYLEAVRCPGQAGTGLRVFVPAALVEASKCYLVRSAQGCYTVRRGPIFYGSQPPGVIETALEADKRCCDCVAGCAHFIGPLGLLCGGSVGPLDCCCPDTFKGNVNIRYDWAKDDVTIGVGYVTHRTVEYIPPLRLQGSYRVVNGALTWNGPNGTPPTQTGILRIRSFDVPPRPGIPEEVQDVPYTATIGLQSGVGGCVPGFAFIGVDFGALTGPFAAYQPKTICQPSNDGTLNTTVTNANSGRSCHVANFLNIWRIDRVDGSQNLGSFETGAYLSTHTTNSSEAKCGDGCGGGTKVGIIVNPAPVPGDPSTSPLNVRPSDPAAAALWDRAMGMIGCQGCGDSPLG